MTPERTRLQRLLERDVGQKGRAFVQEHVWMVQLHLPEYKIIDDFQQKKLKKFQNDISSLEDVYK